jgi:Holliday junction resolvase RusA-like endonuclease
MKITLPILIHTTKSKTPKSKFYLNLNTYRNAHFQKLNHAKVFFKEMVQEMTIEELSEPPYSITYTYYAPTKRKCDISNVCSIIDKFVCDAFTEIGLWEDDNIDFVKKVSYVWGGVDKENPRCEMEVNTFSQKQ